MNQHYVSLTVQVQPIERSHLKLMIVLDNNLQGQSFFFLNTAAVTWMCSVKKVFLKISQSLQENICT